MQKGFSLVELSIVLVILGLLTGGILGGQSLIRAAELRSVSSDITRFQTAMRTFQDKYQALPGDMPNAVKFWTAQAGGDSNGIDATCAALTSTSPATGTATCNGNGDGRISNYWSTAANVTYEYFRFWQHLANAGLIEGTYSGVSGGAANAYTVVAGVNAPQGKLNTSSYLLSYLGTCTACSSAIYDGQYGHFMVVGGSLANNFPSTPIFKPEEAWNIDVKIDDGKPGYGNMTALKVLTCVTSATASAAEYLVSGPNKSCYFYMGNF